MKPLLLVSFIALVMGAGLLAASAERGFLVTHEPVPAAENFVLPPTFIVKGDFPEEKLRKVVENFKQGKIEAPEAIKLPAATNEESRIKNQESRITDSGVGDAVLLAQSDASAPAGFSDPYCSYNNTTKDEQCGGGPIEQLRHTQCTYNPSPSFYDNCNYGNYPNILDPMGSLHPKDPTPRCTTDPTPVCPGGCYPEYTPPCGFVLRLHWPPPACPALPVSCEQCCAGSAWLYDTATNGCSCGVGP